MPCLVWKPPKVELSTMSTRPMSSNFILYYSSYNRGFDPGSACTGSACTKRLYRKRLYQAVCFPEKHPALPSCSGLKLSLSLSLSLSRARARAVEEHAAVHTGRARLLTGRVASRTRRPSVFRRGQLPNGQPAFAQARDRCNGKRGTLSQRSKRADWGGAHAAFSHACAGPHSKSKYRPQARRQRASSSAPPSGSSDSWTC